MNGVLRLRTETVEWREVDGEIVALEASGSRYLAANPAGSLLWRALAKGATRAELVRALSEAYGLDEALAGRDVDAFLAAAAEHGVLDG